MENEIESEVLFSNLEWSGSTRPYQRLLQYSIQVRPELFEQLQSIQEWLLFLETEYGLILNSYIYCSNPKYTKT